MEFPPTIYIGLGVIIAAIITGIISFINLVASKDQKTSEFRQAWIEGLREDICIMLSRIDMIGAEANIHNQLMNAGEMSRTEAVTAYAEKVCESNQVFTEKSRKVILRLNKKDDIDLINLIHKMDSLMIGSFDNLRTLSAFTKIEDKIMKEMQELLKKEWKRVKRGEPSYWLTKYTALIIVVISIITGIVISFDILDITVQLKVSN